MFLRKLLYSSNSLLKQNTVYQSKNLNFSVFNTFFGRKIKGNFDENKDYYKILEINKNASSSEIKQNYYKLAKKNHPDITQGDDTNFKLINEAYSVLRDEQVRQDYDYIRDQKEQEYENFNNSGSQQGKDDGFFSSFFRKKTPEEDMWKNQNVQKKKQEMFSEFSKRKFEKKVRQQENREAGNQRTNAFFKQVFRDRHQQFYSFNHSEFYYGTETFADGGQYFGSFKNNLRDGEGEFTWANGDVYTGEWVNDQMDGFGIWKFVNGSIYEGHFQNGMRNGLGLYTFEDGAYYKGEYFEDKEHGKGKFVSQDHTYEGEFQYGKAHGFGKSKFSDGFVFEGNFMQDVEHGYGEEYNTDGSIYKGNFRNGKKHGKGIFVSPSGQEENQKWVNGKLIK